MGTFLIGAAIRIGKSLAKKHPKRKKYSNFNGKKFKLGMKKFSDDMAEKFMDFLSEKLHDNYRIDIFDISIKRKDIIRGIKVRGGIAVPVKGKFKTIPYREIFALFEYGRLDKGVKPDQVLTRLFIEFKETYTEQLKEELKGKRKRSKRRR